MSKNELQWQVWPSRNHVRSKIKAGQALLDKLESTLTLIDILSEEEIERMRIQDEITVLNEQVKLWDIEYGKESEEKQKSVSAIQEEFPQLEAKVPPES